MAVIYFDEVRRRGWRGSLGHFGVVGNCEKRTLKKKIPPWKRRIKKEEKKEALTPPRRRP